MEYLLFQSFIIRLSTSQGTDKNVLLRVKIASAVWLENKKTNGQCKDSKQLNKNKMEKQWYL